VGGEKGGFVSEKGGGKKGKKRQKLTKIRGLNLRYIIALLGCRSMRIG
jgi:hypothetical protein